MAENTDPAGEVIQVVMRERQGRSLGLWEQLRGCYHPDSRVTTSGFDGNGAEFAEASAAGYTPGLRVVNRMSPPIVRLKGERAVVEAPSTTITWFPIDGVEALLTSYMLLVYRLERRTGEWRIRSLNAINQADTLEPAVPGTALKVDQDRLDGFRWSYRYLCYHASLHGRTIADDLYGDDRPEAANAFLAWTHQWLSGAAPVRQEDR